MTISQSILSSCRARRGRRSSPALVAVTTLLLLSRTASAEPKQNTAREQARELVNQARDAERRGKFLEAAELNKRAYTTMPHPALVYNIAQDYRKAGKKRRAYFYYRTYLDQVKKGPLADASRRHSAAIEKELGAIDLEAINDELAREAVGSKPKPPPSPTGARPPVAGRAPPAPPADSTPPPPASRRGPPPPPRFDAPPPPPSSLRRSGNKAPPTDGSNNTPGTRAGRSITRTARSVLAAHHRYDDAFEGLAPMHPRNRVALTISGADLEGGAEHENFVALLSGHLMVARGFGVMATLPATQTAVEVEEVSSTEIGNIEIGATHTLGFSGQRFMSLASVSLPSSSIGDNDSGELASSAYVARVLGDLMRLALVVPGITTFRFGATLQGGGNLLHYRVAAELGLVSGAPGGVVMSRFDGDLGFHAGIFSLTLGSVTRIGGVLGDIAERDKSALQTLGTTAAIRFSDVSIRLTGGVPLVALGDISAFIGVGVSLNIDRLAK